MTSILNIVFLLILAVGKCDRRTNAFDYDLYESVLNSEACEEDLANMNAFEFYDASFRIPQGILTGSFSNLGNYHQCLAIKQELTENRYIEGKYCMISIPIVQNPLQLPDLSEMSEAFCIRNLFSTEFNTTLPKLEEWKLMKKKIEVITGSDDASAVDDSLMQMLDLNLALCIPKSCTVGEAIGPYFNNDVINVTYSEVFCRLPNDKPFAPADYVAIVILSLIGILTVLSTGFDIYHTVIKKGTKNENKLLRCCSIYNNTNRLLTFNQSQGTLDCLDGLRAISILWVVIGHTFLVRTSTYLNNSLKALDWISSPRSLWILSAPIAVDTFLTLSGLLLVYTAANKMSATDLLQNLHLFYLNRLLRIFPLLALVVLLQASVFNHVSDGVSWYLVASQVDDCRKHWWTALLHLQNYVDMGTICVHPSWYLSVDMQLHILSPLLLFWMLRGRRSAWIALSIAILGSLTGTTVYCYINNFEPSTDRYSKYYYINTLTRCPPFIIGMLYGYVLNITRGKKVKLSSISILIGHLIALCLACLSIYHVYPISQSDWDNQWLTNFILSYIRTCWALSFGWLIFACINGYAGPINWLLSWNTWKLIARISYAMYLFHYPLQYILTGSSITPFHFSIDNGLSAFATDLALTLMTSIAACILVDAPFSTLQKLLFQRLSKRAKKI